MVASSPAGKKKRFSWLSLSITGTSAPHYQDVFHLCNFSPLTKKSHHIYRTRSIMSETDGNSAGEQQPGIDAVKDAMGDLLDNAETQLGFPSQSSSSGKASSRLHYQVHGRLSAQLDTDWEIFPGFTLNEVRLDVEAFYDSDADSKKDPRRLKSITKLYRVLIVFRFVFEQRVYPCISKLPAQLEAATS